MNWLEVGKRTLPSVAQLTIRALRNAARRGPMDMAKARQASLSREERIQIMRDEAKIRQLEKFSERLHKEAGTTPEEVARRTEEQRLINRPRNSGLVRPERTPAERKRYENPLTQEQFDDLMRSQQPDAELRAKAELEKAIPNPFKFDK